MMTLDKIAAWAITEPDSGSDAFGGNGYMAEYRVEQLARDAKSLMIYPGSNEVQVTHIAKGLLAG